MVVSKGIRNLLISLKIKVVCNGMGQVAYGMPIGVPVGISGTVPNLSLSYTDRGMASLRW